MEELQIVLKEDNGESRIRSTDLCDLINMFRKEEGNNTEKAHNDLMKSIRKEVETLNNANIPQGNFSLGSYTDKQNQERPCFYLNNEGVLQMLNKESAVVRYKTVEYIKKLQNQIKQPVLPKTYKEALIELLAQVEENERLQLENTKQKETIEQQENEIYHKEDVIIGLTKEISLAEKRQRITQIIRHNSKKYQERYSLLYTEFEKIYHVDIQRRLDNGKERGEIKKSVNKMAYICDYMNMTNELYEICCKLFESDFIQLLDEWKEIVQK